MRNDVLHLPFRTLIVLMKAQSTGDRKNQWKIGDTLKLLSCLWSQRWPFVKSDIAKVLDLISLAMRIEVPESLSVFGEFCNEISTDLLDSGAMDLGNCS